MKNSFKEQTNNSALKCSISPTFLNTKKNSISDEKDFVETLQNLYSEKSLLEMELLVLKFKNKFKNSPNPDYFLGLSFYERNMLNQAENAFKKSLDKSYNASTLNNLGLVYHKLKSIDKAISSFREANNLMSK